MASSGVPRGDDLDSALEHKLRFFRPHLFWQVSEVNVQLPTVLGEAARGTVLLPHRVAEVDVELVQRPCW